MVVLRWESSNPPDVSQIKKMLISEGLEPKEEIFVVNERQIEKRHPFGEIRIVAAGELHLNISGTKLLLRAGDRIEIPANTKHSYYSQVENTHTIFSHKPY